MMLTNFIKQKPVAIHFHFDSKRLTWKYLKILRNLQPDDVDKIQVLAAHFMTNGNNEYLPDNKAIEILDDLPSDEIGDVLAKFTAALQEASIPKASGNGSRLPSEVGSPSQFPDGS